MEIVDGLMQGVVRITSQFSLRHFHKKGSLYIIEDCGIVSRMKINLSAVKWLTDGGDLSTIKYHGIGTDGTAETNLQTALLAEVQSRATGTYVSAQAGNNATFTSVAQITLDATRTILEWGMFNSATVLGSKLWDRSVINKTGDSGDILEGTYVATFNSEA